MYQFYYSIFFPFHYEQRFSLPISIPLKSNYDELDFWTVQATQAMAPKDITSFLIRLNNCKEFISGQKEWVLSLMQRNSWSTEVVQNYSIHNFIQEEIDNLITFAEVALEYQNQQSRLEAEEDSIIVKENLSTLGDNLLQQMEENPNILKYPTVAISIQNANPLILPNIIYIGQFCLYYLLSNPYFASNCNVLSAAYAFDSLKTFLKSDECYLKQFPCLLRVIALNNSEVFKYINPELWCKGDILQIIFAKKQVADLRKWSKIHGQPLGFKLNKKLAKMAVRNYANNLFSIPNQIGMQIPMIAEALYHDIAIVKQLPIEWLENALIWKIASENIKQPGDANILLYYVRT